MLVIEYLNCEIDNGQFVISFDFPMRIGSRLMPSIESGDMSEYIERFKLAVETRENITIDLAFMIMLAKKERHEIVMALGVDNTLTSLMETCLKYSRKDKNLLGFLYTKSLDFYFKDIIEELRVLQYKYFKAENFVKSIEYQESINCLESTFSYMSKQLTLSKFDFKELYYNDISVFEYDSLEGV